MMRAPSVAIVSDPLVQHGGAERCVEAMAEAFPHAPIYAILYDRELGPAAIAERARPSFLNGIPLARRKHRAFWPLYGAAIESFDLSAYDIIVSSHHTAAKGVVRKANQLHVCYCHTPMRLLWERYFEELQQMNPLARLPARMYFSQQRRYDFFAANSVDLFIANSRETRKRIASHYQRESTVIYPPIDVRNFKPSGEAVSDFFLLASRAVPYKRFDIAIEAAIMAGKKLVITNRRPIGMPEHRNIEYRGHVSDAELVSLMSRCVALVFPQEEDFGMTPLETNACGRPVIAYGAGGALDTVRDGVTGLLVAEQSARAFADAMLKIQTMSFAQDELVAHAASFSRERYVEQLRSFVYEAWAAMTGASFVPRRAISLARSTSAL